MTTGTYLDWGNRDTTLPAAEFRLHAILAFLADANGNLATARKNAAIALKAAGKEHSGFRYHPNAGLVGDVDSTVQSRLQRLAGM